MAEWKEIIEDGVVYYVNEKVGNIMKSPTGQYFSMVPKVVKLGPFDDMGEAVKAAEDKVGLDRVIDNYNLHLLAMIKDLKSGK